MSLSILRVLTMIVLFCCVCSSRGGKRRSRFETKVQIRCNSWEEIAVFTSSSSEPLRWFPSACLDARSSNSLDKMLVFYVLFYLVMSFGARSSAATLLLCSKYKMRPVIPAYSSVQAFRCPSLPGIKQGSRLQLAVD